MAQVKKRRSFAKDTSWEELGWQGTPDAQVSSFILGDPDDPDAPVVFAGKYKAGARTEPHYHINDYAVIMLEGSMQITRKWYRAGDVRIVKAGTGYGPLIAGPEGCQTIVIFRNQHWESYRGPKNRPTRNGDKELTPGLA